MYYEITVSDGQDIMDISIQVYGNAEDVGLILSDNPEINMTTPLFSGQKVKVRKDVLQSSTPQVAKLAREENWQPNNEDTYPAGAWLVNAATVWANENGQYWGF